MKNDLTVIFITNNLLPEEWNKFQQQVLLESIGGAKLIIASRKPMKLGNSINILQTEPSSPSNVYWQMLKACKLADTEYIAMAEDDTLYIQDHFNYRPPKDVFAYNLSHWSLFTWGEPTYGWRNRKGNYSLVANRELVLKALEERFQKYPDGTPPGLTGELGRWRTDKQLGVTHHKAIDFYTNTPIINFNHEMGLDDRQKRHRKTLGTLRAYDIPFWGKASDLVKKFK